MSTTGDSGLKLNIEKIEEREITKANCMFCFHEELVSCAFLLSQAKCEQIKCVDLKHILNSGDEPHEKERKLKHDNLLVVRDLAPSLMITDQKDTVINSYTVNVTGECADAFNAGKICHLLCKMCSMNVPNEEFSIKFHAYKHGGVNLKCRYCENSYCCKRMMSLHHTEKHEKKRFHQIMNLDGKDIDNLNGYIQVCFPNESDNELPAVQEEA